MILTCPKCGTENELPESPSAGVLYRCGNCNTLLPAVRDVPRRSVRILANVGGGLIGTLCWVTGIASYIGVAVWVFLEGNLLWFFLWLFLGEFVVGLPIFLIMMPLMLLAAKLFEIGEGE